MLFWTFVCFCCLHLQFCTTVPTWSDISSVEWYPGPGIHILQSRATNIFSRIKRMKFSIYLVETIGESVTCFSGGWNNNPAALNFKAAYRRLICDIGASGATSNVRSKNDTELVNPATSTYVSPLVNRLEDGEHTAQVCSINFIACNINNFLFTVKLCYINCMPISSCALVYI